MAKSTRRRPSRGAGGLNVGSWMDDAFGVLAVRMADKFLAPKLGMQTGGPIIPVIAALFGHKIPFGNISGAGRALAIDRFIQQQNWSFAGNDTTEQQAEAILRELENQNGNRIPQNSFSGNGNGFVTDRATMPVG